MEFNKKNIKIIICILFGGILFYEILENISNILDTSPLELSEINISSQVNSDILL